MAWNSFATPIALDEHTYGYRWNTATVTETDSFSGPLATLPEYYRLVKGEEKSEWVVVAADEVPAETKLAEVEFHTPPAPPAEPYVTPDNPDSLWKTPGPVAAIVAKKNIGRSRSSRPRPTRENTGWPIRPN